MRLTFATRPSTLARWQTQWVIRALQSAWPGLDCTEQVITTQGDRVLDRPLPEIGGKGLFTQELEAELLGGSLHAAVHSLKDLPVDDPPGLTIGAIPARGNVQEALVAAKGYTIDTLPQNARVGTSSPRRAAQLLHLRPDLNIRPLRGNVDTRLRKALEGQYDAIVLAGIGLIRLELERHITQWLPLDTLLPAPGQGALAVQCRSEDQETLSLLAALEDPPTRAAATAERAFLSGLGGGCAVPVAAYAVPTNQDGQILIALHGLVASSDGRSIVRVRGKGADPVALGMQMAQEALAQGASEILARVR
jgi:hydroxymethylbilane synthase